MFFKEKKEKILPIQDIEIKTWAEQNFMFSILQNMESGWDWIMNHFIQLRGAQYVDYKWGGLDTNVTFYPYAMHNLHPGMMDLCPFIHKYMIPRSLVTANYKSFHEYVECAIDSGFYLSTYLDQFFRQDRKGKHGFHHPNFMYGYSRKKNEVYIMDNFEKGKFGKKKITYQQLDRSYELVPGDLWVVSVFLYQLYPYHYKFVPEYIKEQILDYLEPGKGICYFNRTVCPESLHEDENYYNKVYFGVNCYELLQEYLQGIGNLVDGFRDNDWRNFSMLCDHKRVMVQRYEYMLKHRYIQEDSVLHENLKGLEDECVKMLNIFLKYTLTGDVKYIETVSELLEKVKQEDISCMKKFAQIIIE